MRENICTQCHVNNAVLRDTACKYFRRFFKFSKSFKQFLESFRVSNRDGFNFCPVAMFYREVIDKAYSFKFRRKVFNISKMK